MEVIFGNGKVSVAGEIFVGVDLFTVAFDKPAVVSCSGRSHIATKPLAVMPGNWEWRSLDPY
jgi:hypothetical protein